MLCAPGVEARQVVVHSTPRVQNFILTIDIGENFAVEQARLSIQLITEIHNLHDSVLPS
jgi:hypothetical protein